MNFQQLENFLTICQLGSFTAASKKLFVSQPALSQQISRLEAELGMPVFTRSSTSLELTSAGERLRSSCEIILGEYHSMITDINQRKDSNEQYLTVAATKTRSLLPMTYLLPRFSSAFPQIHTKIFEVNSYQVEEALISGKADLGFCQPPDYMPIKTETVYEDEVLVAVPHDHPLNSTPHPHNGRYPVLFAEDLDHQTFIQGPPESFTQRHVSLYFTEHHIHPTITTQSYATEYLHFFTAIGMGLSFVSELNTLLLPSNHQPPIYYSIGDVSLKQPISIGYRESSLVTPTMRQFIDFITEEFPRIFIRD